MRFRGYGLQFSIARSGVFTELAYRILSLIGHLKVL